MQGLHDGASDGVAAMFECLRLRQRRCDRRPEQDGGEREQCETGVTTNEHHVAHGDLRISKTLSETAFALRA
jgi:hypothetical protein